MDPAYGRYSTPLCTIYTDNNNNNNDNNNNNKPYK